MVKIQVICPGISCFEAKYKPYRSLYHQLDLALGRSTSNACYGSKLKYLGSSSIKSFLGSTPSQQLLLDPNPASLPLSQLQEGQSEGDMVMRQGRRSVQGTITLSVTSEYLKCDFGKDLTQIVFFPSALKWKVSARTSVLSSLFQAAPIKAYPHECFFSLLSARLLKSGFQFQ